MLNMLEMQSMDYTQAQKKAQTVQARPTCRADMWRSQDARSLITSCQVSVPKCWSFQMTLGVCMS